MLKSAALMAAAFAMQTSPATAQMKPASAEHIAAAVGACIVSTGPNGVDRKSLADKGWVSGAFEKDGKQVETPLQLYSAKDNAAVILSDGSASGSRNACIVIASLPNFDRYMATADGLGRVLGKPFNRDGNQFYWRHGPLIIELAATGTRAKPGIRVGVVAVPEEKK